MHVTWEDWSEVLSCKGRYVRGADDKDPDLFASAFSTTGVWDERGWADPPECHPDSEGSEIRVPLALLNELSRMLPWPICGRDNIRSSLGPASGVITFHGLFQPTWLDMRDGRIDVVWPFHDELRFSGLPGISLFRGTGRYVETYVREDDAWLIGQSRMERCSIAAS